MTRKEAIRQNHQADTLVSLGFTYYEAESLRRISMTLRRWYELECGIDGGCIERDELTDKPFWLSSFDMRRSPVADREKGAKRRLNVIIAARHARHYVNGKPPAVVSAYIQTDPRGAALYIIRPGDVPEGARVDSYYTRGICVY